MGRLLKNPRLGRGMVILCLIGKENEVDKYKSSKLKHKNIPAIYGRDIFYTI